MVTVNSPLRVGSIVYATDQGLGILAKSFYNHRVLTDVLIQHHSHYPDHVEWYPPCPVLCGKTWAEEKSIVDELISRVNVLLFFETPFYWQAILRARERKVPTVLMPMYECTHENPPYVPDFFLCPSLLDLECYSSHPSAYLPVPVSSGYWRKRERAEVFVHNAGHGGLQGRNGTGELLDAMRLVKSPVRLILRTQKRLQWEIPRNVEVRIGTLPHEELFTEGDVYIAPEKFNGLSLPLQEARAAGMLVMTSDRFPSNTWLPRDPLIPVSRYERRRLFNPCREIDVAVLDPKDIAAKIDEWYGRDIAGYSESGREWAENNSWINLVPRYLDLLQRIVREYRG